MPTNQSVYNTGAKITAGVARTGCALMISLLFLITTDINAETTAGSDFEFTEETSLEELYNEVWRLLQNIHKDISGLDRAIGFYQRAFKNHPHDPVLHWKYSEIVFKKAEATEDKHERKALYETSLLYARKAMELTPSLESHFWVGCNSTRLAEMVGTFSALSIIKEGIRELEITIDLDPNHRLSIIAGAILAAIYTEAPWPLRDLDKAVSYAESAVRKDPNLSFACSRLTAAYVKQKLTTRARKEAGRCLSLAHPTYPWDAELYNWPDVRKLLKEIEDKN